MKISVETEFGVGDKVWYLDFKNRPGRLEVSSIQVTYERLMNRFQFYYRTNKYRLVYLGDSLDEGRIMRVDNQVYRTREEARKAARELRSQQRELKNASSD